LAASANRTSGDLWTQDIFQFEPFGDEVFAFAEESPKYILNLLVTPTKPVAQNASLESYPLSKEQAAASGELTTLTLLPESA
jgi:hypothetical protein